MDRHHIQVSEQRIFYTWSEDQASPENIRAMIQNLYDFCAANQPPMGYILHLATTARPPSAEDRIRSTEAFNRCAARLAGVAIVLDAKGFAGALLRSAVNAVFFIKRQGFTPRVFESVHLAADWLGAKTFTPSGNIVELARYARDRFTHQLPEG
jgi:hypothetical protein